MELLPESSDDKVIVPIVSIPLPLVQMNYNTKNRNCNLTRTPPGHSGYLLLLWIIWLTSDYFTKMRAFYFCGQRGLTEMIRVSWRGSFCGKC